jgi:hypothetical protein
LLGYAAALIGQFDDELCHRFRGRVVRQNRSFFPSSRVSAPTER